MRKIIGEKSKIINKIYIMSLFLVLGVLRPIIIKFFNLDIFMVVATVFLLLMIVNVMIVKVTIPQKSCILDHSVNTFCMGAILIIIRNGSGIISPILSIFTCILIGLSYSEKFKVSKFMEPTAYIVIIGVVGLSFIYFTQGFQYNKQIEEPSKESKRNTIEEDKQIKDKIENMTLEEKIGQMIVAGFNGTKVNEEVNTLVKDLKVGGVILFSRNIENSAQLKNLNDNISKLNKDIELFISIDEEGGRVTRLPSDTIKFKSAKEIGETGDLDYAYENGENIGMTLKEHGFNMDFAPVLDIYSNPKNTVIGDRAFGSDEKIVSDMGIATMKGIEEGCVVPVVKHFPGHGDTEVDSHFGLPIVTKDLKELEKFEFIPFKKAIKEGCDVVMVSH
ncbi:MAG: glycoside hydrolase family 3 N-terminal domain-containing protein, partial [Paraclostridium sp.]